MTENAGAAKASKDADIKNLQFPDSIRLKLPMYIGPTDEYGLFSIIREVTDNVVDEALRGTASHCHVHLNGQEYWVLDDGPGVPVKNIKVKDSVHGKEHLIPAIKAIFAMTHTSGKFDGTAYAASRGTHGVGAKCTNAASAEFEVWTFNAGAWHHIMWRKGVLVQDLEKLKQPPLNPFSNKPVAKGTVIRFVPDYKLFSAKSFPTSLLSEWASTAAYFTPKLTILLSNAKGASKTLHYPEGPKSFLQTRIEKLGCPVLSPKSFFVSTPSVDCALQFADYVGSDLRAFTNGLQNADGGTHVQALLQALQAALKPYAKKRQDYGATELREGVIGLLNAKLSHPEFSGQTKDKLVDKRAAEPLRTELTKHLTEFFKTNKGLAEQLLARADALRAWKEQSLASRKAMTQLKGIQRKGFPAKAAMASRAKPEEREVYLIEGDSAAGSSRLARDEKYQELLPLKGKIANALKHASEKVLGNDEVLYILAMLGFDPKSENPYDKLRTRKIIWLADPDPDGPLDGDTLVSVLFEDEWHTLPIRELASETWMNRTYKVHAWDGRSFQVTEAHDARVTTQSDKEVCLKVEGIEEKILCAPSHQWPLAVKRYDTRIAGQLNNGMQMIRAEQIKCGDSILVRDHDTGKMVERKILKHKVMKLPDTKSYYCLTVPVFHNFALANGVMSKNCHINCLGMTLLYKYLPELFERGYVYVVDVLPFYALHPKTNEMLFGRSAKEVQAKLDELGIKANISHIKGYGELSPKLLKRIAFDPATRTLTQITSFKSKADQDKFVAIMGEGSEARKELLGI